MRRIAILLCPLVVACAAEDPPPGNLIGTFDFLATLEPEGACILEEVAGVPESFSFTAILSHEPETGKLWLRAGATEQVGEIQGNQFRVRTPSEGGIPRTYSACTLARRQPCPLLLTEILEAEILSDCPREFEAENEALPCPERGEDGSLLWHNCACVRGRLEEFLRFEAEEDELCSCQGVSRTEVFEGSCRLGYRLEGEKR